MKNYKACLASFTLKLNDAVAVFLQTYSHTSSSYSSFVSYLQFVAHSHCQQRLIEQWYHGLPGWRDQGSCRTSSLMILMGLCFPILSCCYIFSPCGKIGRFLRVPYVKFVCHTASQIYFLGLLLLHTLVENQIPVDEKDGLTNAGAEPPSVIIILIMLWVAGKIFLCFFLLFFYSSIHILPPSPPPLSP